MKLPRFFCVFSRFRVLLRACFGAASGESITHEQSCFRKKKPVARVQIARALLKARLRSHVMRATQKIFFRRPAPPPLNYARSTDRLDF